MSIEQFSRLLDQRCQELANEEAYVKDHIGQIGTSIPTFMTSIDTFVVNPSNVGLGVISRMIETDETIFSSILFKSLMMLAKIGDYHHNDKKIKDFVNDFLGKLSDPTWPETLEAMSSSYAYGFSVSEIIWGLNKRKEKVPVRVPTYHPTTIVFETGNDGRITEDGIVQFTTQYNQQSNPNYYFPFLNNGFYLKNPFETPTDRILPYRIPFINNFGAVRIPRSKCVHHVNHSMFSFGSPYGKTSVRTAHLAWQLKVFFMKQMGIAGKRQATPTLWATAPHNANKVRVTHPNGKTEDLNPVEALNLILKSRENDDAVITGPESAGYKLQVIGDMANMNSFIDVIQLLNVLIFRSFVLPSLVLTDGSAGSRSLGDKHFQVVDRIAESDAKKFTMSLVNQLIRPAIVDNFGEQDDYGHFMARPQNIEERERMANMFRTLGDGGWLDNTAQEDVEFVRASLHLPDKKDQSFYSEESPLKPGDEGYSDDFSERVNDKLKGEGDEA
jgi:hypothetical protein